MKIVTSQFCFAAVRQAEDSNRPYIDLYSISTIAECVNIHNENIKKQIPQWDKANPVLRVARIELKEVDGLK
jgi:hypothetical protein